MYPSDAVGLQQLADALTAAGYKPTQDVDMMIRVKIDQMAQNMVAGTFDWSLIQPWEKIILGPDGEIMDGHHRVVAAVLSGCAIPTDQIYPYSGTCYRPVFAWIDVLPK